MWVTNVSVKKNVRWWKLRIKNGKFKKVRIIYMSVKNVKV